MKWLLFFVAFRLWNPFTRMPSVALSFVSELRCIFISLIKIRIGVAIEHEEKISKRQESRNVGKCMSIQAINTVINYPRPRSKWIHTNIKKKQETKRKKKKKNNCWFRMTNQRTGLIDHAVPNHSRFVHQIPHLLTMPMSLVEETKEKKIIKTMTKGRPMITIFSQFL